MKKSRIALERMIELQQRLAKAEAEVFRLRGLIDRQDEEARSRARKQVDEARHAAAQEVSRYQLVIARFLGAFSELRELDLHR